MRALKVQSALGVDHDWNTGGTDQNISPFRFRHELHLITQAVTTAPGYRDAQVFTTRFTLHQCGNFTSSGLRQSYEVLISFPDTLWQRRSVGHAGYSGFAGKERGGFGHK